VAFKLQLLAVQGYVVIEPSAPMPPGRGPRAARYDDAARRWRRPRCRKAAITAGYVDPGRVHVLGQSFRGYALYRLLARTTTFRSGIALAGPSDLISLSGTFDARFRYNDFDHGFSTR